MFRVFLLLTYMGQKCLTVSSSVVYKCIELLGSLLTPLREGDAPLIAINTTDLSLFSWMLLFLSNQLNYLTSKIIQTNACSKYTRCKNKIEFTPFHPWICFPPQKDLRSCFFRLAFLTCSYSKLTKSNIIPPQGVWKIYTPSSEYTKKQSRFNAG